MIIGLLGFAGSGKGAVGEILIDRGYHKLAFADPLKDATSQMFSWPRHLLEGDTEESRKFREKADPWWSERLGFEVTPRYFLQLMGTEAGRQVFHSDVWIYALERRMDKLGKNANVVLTDVRFQNEIDFVRKKGGYLVRVKRGPEPDWYGAAFEDNILKTDNMERKYPKIHFSEWAWIGTIYDYVIDNKGSLQDLQDETKGMLTLLENRINMKQAV